MKRDSSPETDGRAAERALCIARPHQDAEKRSVVNEGSHSDDALSSLPYCTKIAHASEFECMKMKFGLRVQLGCRTGLFRVRGPFDTPLSLL